MVNYTISTSSYIVQSCGIKLMLKPFFCLFYISF